MSSIDTCWTCGNSDIEAIEKVALAITLPPNSNRDWYHYSQWKQFRHRRLHAQSHHPTAIG